MVSSAPALTVAAGLIVKTISSFRAPHGPLGSFVVNVNVTEPAAISAADGVYTAFIADALLNVPVPLVVQVADAAPPPIIPLNVRVLVEQIVSSIPALTVTAGFMVNNKASFTAAQGPDGSFVVNVNVTEPAEISAALGVYTAFIADALLNVPVPLVVQVPDVASPPIVPFKVCVLVEQMVSSAPALTVAAGLIVKIIASESVPQDSGSFVVKVKVTPRLVISNAEGVYTAFSAVALLNVPVPAVVQVPIVAPPEIEPESE